MRKQLEFIKNRINSFKYAYAGLIDVMTTEHNAWVHATFTLLVLVACAWLQISFVEFALIIIVISLVWLAEAFNTVLEIVIDIVSPEYTEAARRAKDIAAGAVLVASIGAFITGLILLCPLIFKKIGF